MSKSVVTINCDDRLGKVREIFNSNPFHHLVVLKNDKVCGIISKIDLMKGESGASSSTLVEDIMTRDPLSVDPEDSIGLAADIILANAFHSLPVVSDGDLVGIITSHDLIKHAYK